MDSLPDFSTRCINTDIPVMVKIRELMSKGGGGGCNYKDPMPLGMGSVYWHPPDQILEKVKDFAKEPLTSRYGNHEGIQELQEALIEKLRVENGIRNSSVMVTSGSNQAFLNLVLALCDATTDAVIVFAPYFFNMFMTFKMSGISNILVGPSDPDTLQPDLNWLQKTLEQTARRPRMVCIVNPGNPSGTCVSLNLLQRIAEVCENARTWLVVDNAYEYFTYDDDHKHHTVEGRNVINLFSFSKSYGMMGWRLGYIAYSRDAKGLRDQLLKTQDNAAICAPVISQRLGLACLREAGRDWVKSMVSTLLKSRDLALEVVTATLGREAVKGGGAAIYIWVKLPQLYRDVDVEVVTWMARKHGVVLLPGSSCGVPGCVRLTFGAVEERVFVVAAGRLRKGLEELVSDGMVE